MSKSVELLAGSEDSEPIPTSNTISQERSRLNLNGSRQLSKSATELRDSEIANSSPSRRGNGSGESGIIHHHRHHRHHGTVAQRTHTFFATLKSRWSRSRSKERKKSKDAGSVQSQDAGQLKNLGVESDYAADYSSEHSRSSSATQSPARHCLNRPESPLARSSREKTVTVQEDNAGKCSEGFSKGPVSFQKEGYTGEEPQGSYSQDGDFLQDEMIRRREQALRQHAFFQLRLHIRRGANLVAMDRCGASDPYVKVKCSGRLLHKSRTVHRDLNPVWDESVTLPIEDPFQPLTIKVFDYDWGLQDDFMGAALLDLTQLDLGHSQDITLELKDPVRPKQHLGEIYLTATLWPRNQQEKEQYFQRTNRLADVNRRLKSQIWSSVVTIVLVEAKNLLPMDIDGLSDPYVKFRLGTEKYKSKVVNKTLNPIWLEQFDLHLYEDPYLGQELEVTVWDRDRSHQDDLMGKTMIDLATLERETTHRLWRELEDGSGNIFLLLTISGTTASETISDLAIHEETPIEQAQLVQRYSITNTLQRIRDVGHLTVKVYRAQGLAAADLGGKSDPFCVLELVNSRLQTQTEYKTLTPNWQKIFTFNVKDINSVLEVTVYDEDRDHKVEFLGRVAIPLLKIRNGEKRWYALKDKKLRGRAKGNCPQILLEMTVIWNLLRACIRTLNPKEKKYMEPEVKFKRQVFLRNVLRLKAIIVIFIDIGKYIQSCWEWESKMRSIFALVIFILGCYYFEPYMIPGVALLILLKYYLLIGERSGFNHWICGQVAVVTGAPLIYATSQFQDHAEIGSDDCPPTPGDDDDDEDDKDKEEKKSLKERLQAIQEVTQTVQNSIGYIASLCEKVKNLFNFTIPYLSYLAMLLAIAGAVVLYFIPVRYLILAWGVNKFSRKIFRPHSVPNNEVLDLISRVPDDEELLNYRELKPVPTADCERGGSSGSPSSNAARREQRKRHKAA
ncbi:PREDICTED: multiple C2 and transmembrane domain-containing protein 1 isoform X5 [Acromyrmex echinatior]|uniref:multiple C2 and transmembrane domain-containing protein 1 isoform X5 n=1 Tax=Acromyrmex echinatior TaxID=103372 RepID=UPI000580D2BD|nr:PREDICTED: multiple C2 and transmembrane domain-containing protein 1 isoform X5 [Acromyrmex echinatior]XP_011057571.1 PREDICTED: multiple C2 and transmembrane domain-containing protein 1 isoform X5 [Acromyrmex echinatior]XP_011057572.1 PREDICTED: multiple C2 and transmembrane domain-containing protein 1 isoform X5 [Acromyrmex echinatior]XP_011057573.1 PREDICTED: multiple C2 and transmembrane domain-containing protein 1 isoform X5 [Acromyrmex echinatior]XP_011057574.1 PREDICTED: multiple C2 a